MASDLKTYLKPPIATESGCLSKVGLDLREPRVLLADDNEEMRRVIAGLIEGEFHVVGMASDGSQLSELVSGLSPDILVLDISMPLVNGIEAALRLKRTGSTAKVVFLTIYKDPDFVEAAMSAGACGYVLKACLVTDLLPAMREALGGGTFVSPDVRLQ